MTPKGPRWAPLWVPNPQKISQKTRSKKHVDQTLHTKCFPANLLGPPPILKIMFSLERNHRFHISTHAPQRPQNCNPGTPLGCLWHPILTKCLKGPIKKIENINESFNASRRSNGHRNDIQKGLTGSILLVLFKIQMPLSSKVGPRWLDE